MSKSKGKFIDTSTANTEINEFIKIRDESYHHIVSKLESEGCSKESIKYYSDQEVSFIFDVNLIETMISETKAKGGNAIRCYYGADPGKSGSSTLVFVAAKIYETSGVITAVKNVFSDDLDHAGIEYPGGGVRLVKTPGDIDIKSDDLTAVSDFR